MHPSVKDTFSEKHQLYLNDPDDFGFYRETFAHSRDVIKLFHNFKMIVHKEPMEFENYNSLIQKYKSTRPFVNRNNMLKLKTTHPDPSLVGIWELIAGRKMTKESNNTDSDNITSEGTIHYSTITVHPESVSINNGKCHELPSPVITAEILRANDDSNEDTLILVLMTGVLLLRFIPIETKRSGYKYFPFVVDAVESKAFNFKTTVVFVNSQKDVMTIFDKRNSMYFYNIYYDSHGIPELHFRNRLKDNLNSAGCCIIPITNNDDAIVIVQIQEDSVHILSFYNLKNLKMHNNNMKNTFALPSFVIPLANSSAVLFLQQNEYTIYSINFCLSGEDLDTNTFQYPSFDFQIQSYYIPTSTIITELTHTNVQNTTLKHDQVIVSTRNNSVYIIDVFYDSKCHKFTSHSYCLFKFKNRLDNFIFEKLLNTEFNLIYASFNGIHESRIVSIEMKNDAPILKTTTKYWSSVYPYPIVNFQVIDSPDLKKSAEYPSQELWTITGEGSTHALTNFKFGLMARDDRYYKKNYQANKLHSFITDNLYVWISDNDRSELLCQDDEMSQEFVSVYNTLIDGQMLSYEWLNEEMQCLITKSGIYYFNVKTLKYTYHLKFPNNCILAHSYLNTCVLVNSQNEHELIVFQINDDLSCTMVPVVNNESDCGLISMVYIQQKEDALALYVGYFNGFLSVFKKGNDDKEFTRSENLNICNFVRKSGNCLDVPDYSFVPHQMHSFDGTNYILTSKSGDYIIVEFDQFDNFSFQSRNYTKLGDSGPVDIVSSNSHVFLLSKSLWELKIATSSYPERVVFTRLSDFNAKITACTILESYEDGETSLMISTDFELKSFIISSETSVITLRGNLAYGCLSMLYFRPLDIFILLTEFKSSNKEIPKLLFLDAKSLKLLETRGDINDIFEDLMIPMCLEEWKLDTDSGSYYNVIVGTSHSDFTFGGITFLKLTRSGNKIDFKVISQTEENGPVTNLYYNSKIDMLIYSSGNGIYYRAYSKNKSKFVTYSSLFLLEYKIYRFSYMLSETSIFLIVSSRIGTKTEIIAKIESILLKDEEDLDEDDVESDDTEKVNCLMVVRAKVDVESTCFMALLADDNFMIQNNVAKQSFSVVPYYYSNSELECTEQKTKTEFYLDNYSGLSFLNSYPPWMSIADRQKNYQRQMLSIGLKGHIGLFKFCSPDIQDEMFANRLKGHSRSFMLSCTLLEESLKTNIVKSSLLKSKYQKMGNTAYFTEQERIRDRDPEVDLFTNSILL